LLAMAACQPTNFFRMYPVQLWERACPRRRSDSRPISRRHTRINCGSEPAREDGLRADRNLADVLSTVGASLLAIATCQSTRYITDERPPQTGRPVGRLGRCCGVRPLVRPSAGYAQWATRHGCRVSRPRPWMADGGGLCRSELARENLRAPRGARLPASSLTSIASKLAPTGFSK
jgi:hypothetical protein